MVRERKESAAPAVPVRGGLDCNRLRLGIKGFGRAMKASALKKHYDSIGSHVEQ